MLKKFCDFVVEKRKWFLLVFLVLTIVFAVLIFQVKINYDMTDYLPEDSVTFEAMDKMFGEFGEGASASIMVSTVKKENLNEVADIRQKMSKVKGVNSVLWIDSALIEYYPMAKDMEIDMPLIGHTTIGEQWTTPESFANAMMIVISNDMVPDNMAAMLDMMLGQFYKDGNALIQIFFDENAYSKKTVYAIDELKQIVIDAGYTENLGGMAASAYAMETIMESELFKLILIVAPTIILLLFLSTSSYFEPVVYLTVIGISVILNMGSNVMMSSVSYLTFSIAALIQVAVSMDYSIFIMHAYKANRVSGLSKVDSAKLALRKSLSSVSASSLTTIAGFIALMFMRYKIGTDIGLVLAKGILCSLITAFLFMPGFLVLCDKPIMKGEHKTIVQLIKNAIIKRKAKKAGTTVEDIKSQPAKQHKLGDNLLKLRFVIPVIFIAVLAPAYIAQSGNHFMYGELASSGGDGSTLMIDRAAIEKVYGTQNQMVVMLNKKHQSREADIATKLSTVDNIASVMSLDLIKEGLGLPEEKIPSFMLDQFVSENYRLIVMAVDTGEEDEAAFKAVNDVKALMSEELDDGYYLIGNSVVAQELKNINNKDYTITTSLALLFIFIILLFTFKGLVLPLILALLIQGSIWLAMTIPSLANMPLVFLGYLIVSCFQMGCTIDYGILFSNNYLNLRKENDKLTACKLAFKTSFGAITLSAAILMTVGYTVGIAGSIPATSNIGLLLGIGATVSYLAMTFVLPMFLVLLDKPIRLTTLKLGNKKATDTSEHIETNN